MLPNFLTTPTGDLYRSDNYVVVDFETTGIDYGDPANNDNSILLGCWRAEPEGRIYLERSNEYGFQQLLSRIERADFVVAHNTKFEIGWLRRCGLKVEETLFFCTQIAEYTLTSNTQAKLSLAACLERRGLEGKDIVGSYIKSGVAPEELPYSWLSKYCIRDVEQTAKLFREQRDQLIGERKLQVAFTRNLLTPVLSDLEHVGMHLDAKRVDKLYREEVQNVNKRAQEFDELTGGLNVRSPKQKAEYIFSKSGMAFSIPRDHKRQEILSPLTGLPKTDKATLGLLRPTNRKQKRFLELLTALSESKQALSKYLEKFQAACKEAEGIILGNIGQTFTQTGRLNSNGIKYRVQMQNIRREYKRLFNARTPGWKIAEADLSSLEFRVAAHLGSDERAITDILKGFDPHAFSASQIFGQDWADETISSERRSALRTSAKAYTFKPLYGGTSGTPQERRYYDAFRKRYPGIDGTQQAWISEVLRTGKLRLPTGLEFFFPDTKVEDSGYIVNTTKICNYPVQYLATGEIVLIGVVYQWHMMNKAKMKSFMTNTIHDSTIVELEPTEEEKYREIVKKVFLKIVPWYLRKVYKINFSLPLDTEVKIGHNWGA